MKVADTNTNETFNFKSIKEYIDKVNEEFSKYDCKAVLTSDKEVYEKLIKLDFINKDYIIFTNLVKGTVIIDRNELYKCKVQIKYHNFKHISTLFD